MTPANAGAIARRSPPQPGRSVHSAPKTARPLPLGCADFPIAAASLPLPIWATEEQLATENDLEAPSVLICRRPLVALRHGGQLVGGSGLADERAGAIVARRIVTACAEAQPSASLTERHARRSRQPFRRPQPSPARRPSSPPRGSTSAARTTPATGPRR